MPHRRIIIEVWGSTDENAQNEVNRIMRFLRHHEYGESAACVDPHRYGENFDEFLTKQLIDSESIGGVLPKNFVYEVGRLNNDHITKQLEPIMGWNMRGGN